MKIIAKVEYNDGHAYVLDKNLDTKYIELENGSLVGFDDTKTFYSYFTYRRFDKGAFGGREFAVEMVDGSIKKLKDNWWSGGDKYIEKYFNDNNIQLQTISAESRENLIDCYEFCGYDVDIKKFKKLEKNYTNKIYSRKELENDCRARYKRKNAINFKDYDGDYFSIDLGIIKREKLYKKIESRNFKKKKLNRMSIYGAEKKHNFFFRSHLILFNDEDVKQIKKEVRNRRKQK